MKRILEFLRLTDTHDGKISLTNVALLVVLVKIAAASEVSLVDAGALLVALLSYQGKKVINRDERKPKDVDVLRKQMDHVGEWCDTLNRRIDELSSKVSQQQMAMGIKDLRK